MKLKEQVVRLTPKIADKLVAMLETKNNIKSVQLTDRGLYVVLHTKQFNGEPVTFLWRWNQTWTLRWRDKV